MTEQTTGILATLASVLGLSFASGVNLYAAVLTIGLGVRFGWLGDLPPEMQSLGHPLVLGIAGAMYLAEFVADKIPYFTPIWDAIHTLIRPVGGAMLALRATSNMDPVAQAIAALLGGGIALGAHSSKTGFRLLAHAAPEPATHSLISMAEDVGVVGLIALAYSNPEVAIWVVGFLLVLVAVFTPVLLRVLKFLANGVLGRVRSWFSEATDLDVPDWVKKDIQRMGLPGEAIVLRCFTRSGTTVSRLRESYLVRAQDQWWLIQRRLVGENVKMLSDAGVESAARRTGVIYDVVRFRLGGKKRHSFYVTKEWSSIARSMVPHESHPDVPETAPGPELS